RRALCRSGPTPPVSVPNLPQTLTQPTSTRHWTAHPGTRVALSARATVKDFATLAVPPAESVTCSVKRTVPAALGVPATVPLVEIVKPAGIAPLETLHV